MSLEWTSTGQPTYAVFRSDEPWTWTDAELLGVETGTQLVDGAVAGAPLLFYLVQ